MTPTYKKVVGALAALHDRTTSEETQYTDCVLDVVPTKRVSASYNVIRLLDHYSACSSGQSSSVHVVIQPLV